MIDSSQLASLYTLIIPTYNRRSDLARLLRSLQRQNAQFPILVLDSSDADTKSANRSIIASVQLTIQHLEFDSSLAPFDKFWKGALEVKTPFCSMCADDDVLVVSSLPPIVETLNSDDSIAVAHGWYFTFYMTDHVGVTSIVYKGASIAGSPLDRMRHLLSRYEALTYGVYRTNVMAQVLDSVRAVSSILFREVGAGVLTMGHGGVARVPLLYYGRALGASQSYSDWHPVEFLIGSPVELFQEYAKYRTVLMRELFYGSPPPLPAAEVERLVDLFHLRYLSDFLQPRVVDHVIDGLQTGHDRSQILRGVWPLLQPSGSGVWDVLRGHPTLQKLRERLQRIKSLPRPLLRHGIGKDEIVKCKTESGTDRSYRLYGGLTEALGELAQARATLLKIMGSYE